MKLFHLIIPIGCAATLLITTTHVFADNPSSSERALQAAQRDFDECDESLKKATEHAGRAAAASEKPELISSLVARREGVVAAHHGNVAVRANVSGYEQPRHSGVRARA